MIASTSTKLQIQNTDISIDRTKLTFYAKHVFCLGMLLIHPLKKNAFHLKDSHSDLNMVYKEFPYPSKNATMRATVR